jgi:hypothetical protein
MIPIQRGEAAEGAYLFNNNNGSPGQSRTADLRFRKPLLYPSELQGHSSYQVLTTLVYRRRELRIVCSGCLTAGMRGLFPSYVYLSSRSGSRDSSTETAAFFQHPALPRKIDGDRQPENIPLLNLERPAAQQQPGAPVGLLCMQSGAKQQDDAQPESWKSSTIIWITPQFLKRPYRARRAAPWRHRSRLRSPVPGHTVRDSRRDG